MARRPLILAFLAAVALAVPLAGRAGVPVGLYPVQSDGLTDAERGEVQAVVVAALQGADRRGVLEPRSPLVLVGSCKVPITVGCVATLAKGGVVLYAKAKRRGAAISVTILFVDATGRKTRAVSFPVDPFIQNLRPANDAIAALEGDLAAGVLEEATPPPPAVARAGDTERPPPPAAAAPRAEPSLPPARPAAPPAAEAPPARAPQASAVEPPPARTTQPVDLTPLPPARSPAPTKQAATAPAARDVVPAPLGGDGYRTAGTWCTGGGIAMVLAGAAFGLSAKRLSDTLSDRYAKRALTPDDRRLYDRVELYEKLANGLLIAGGAALTAGFTFHALAPEGGGVSVSLAGSF